MATLVIVGSRETRVIARSGRSPLVYTPARRSRGQRMSEPRHGIVDGLDGGRLRRPSAGAT